MPPEDKREVKVKYSQATGMPSVYADQATAQTLGETILLTFYQIEPPLLTLESENLEKLETVVAFPIARIAMTPVLAQAIGRMFQPRQEEHAGDSPIPEEQDGDPA